MTGDVQNPSPLDTVREAFAEFLKHNPYSKISEGSKAEQLAKIDQPWDDESFGISVPKDYQTLAEALNSVYLPARYSAIYHRDTKRLEFIWTAYPLNPMNSAVGRKFTFRFRGRTHECEYTDSSGRLLAIAANFFPIRSGSTQFRNLESFRFHIERVKSTTKGPPEIQTRPISFWVSGFEWNEDELLELSNHLNFFMTYYDATSPFILIHSFTEGIAKPQARFPFGEFPPDINAREIDDVLLALWQASRNGDSAMRFLYGFRIIEYASFSYLDAKGRMEIRRILAAPHAASQMSGLIDDVVAALERSKPENDWTRCEALLRETVSAPLLWKEIKENFVAFSTSTQFDGGFTLQAMLPKESKDPPERLAEIVHKPLRQIRNALSHGKDEKASGVITPTMENFAKLRPWASLVSVVAGEVMLYRNMV